MSLKDISYLELWRPSCSVELNHLGNFYRGHYEENFCEINLNTNQWFRRCGLMIFLILPCCLSERNCFCNFGKGQYKDHFCEIILNLNQWFSMSCPLKYFLSRALMAILFGGAKPFRPLWYRALGGTFVCSSYKFEPVI